MVETTTAAEPSVRRRLEVLDVLRFTAALMVVLFHWGFNGINNGKVDSFLFTSVAPLAVYGYYGVHLFFLISGYVIAESARNRTAGQFVVTRGVRLFPAYWIGMIATTAVVGFWGSDSLQVGAIQFFANLTMVPSLFGQSAIDGVYWTLTIELTFYFFVLVVLLLGFGRYLDTLFPAWAILMFVVAIVAPSVSGSPYLGGYYAFFAAGAIMAMIRRRGFTVFGCVGLIAATVTAFMFVISALPAFNRGHAFVASPVIVCLMIAFFFCVIALLWIPRVAELRIPFSRGISDLTYPIYLLHAHIGYTVLQVFGGHVNPLVLYSLMSIGLLVAGWLLHWGIEVKLQDFWFQVFGILRRPMDFLQGAAMRLSTVLSSVKR